MSPAVSLSLTSVLTFSDYQQHLLCGAGLATLDDKRIRLHTLFSKSYFVFPRAYHRNKAAALRDKKQRANECSKSSNGVQRDPPAQNCLSMT